MILQICNFRKISSSITVNPIQKSIFFFRKLRIKVNLLNLKWLLGYRKLHVRHTYPPKPKISQFTSFASPSHYYSNLSPFIFTQTLNSTKLHLRVIVIVYNLVSVRSISSRTRLDLSHYNQFG